MLRCFAVLTSATTPHRDHGPLKRMRAFTRAPRWIASGLAAKRGMATAAELAAAEARAAAAAGAVIEPVTGRTLEQLGMVAAVRCRGGGLPSASSASSSGDACSAAIELPTGAYPERAELESRVASALLEHAPGGSVGVSFQLRAPRSKPHVTELRRRASMVTDGLSEVSAIVGVSSCKGGVGKSTVALHLAYSLAAMGGRVGLFDADIHGPSLPSMVVPEDTRVVRLEDKGWLRPLRHEGVKLMSYGWVSPRNEDGERGGAAMRGPMASSVVQQLSQLTDWGPLDVLVVDMPPGTGDVIITLGQKMALAGAVIVTTPHELARVDVSKGVALFDRMRVPSLALVNNMAYLRPAPAAPAAYPFGRAEEAMAELRGRCGIPSYAAVPLHEGAGQRVAWPYSSPEMPDEEGGGASRPFSALADGLVRELMRREAGAARSERRSSRGQAGAGASAAVSFVGSGGTDVGVVPGGGALTVRRITDDGAEQHSLPAAAARRASLAADAGEPSDVDDGVTAVRCEAQGNYAVEVAFSDGHTAILPLASLLALARAQTAEAAE